ncbi:MAG: tetratricopeptide repeat protein [Caulobacter sp.]|nr:tetratricopeptide repeat protein [Caulobacter sp.]
MDWARLEEALDQALDQSPATRQSWIDTTFADAPELRRELMSLLAAAEAGADFLINDEETLVQSLLAGARLGVWQVADLLGAGGMGEVYRVERVDGEYQQQAALKLMRALPASYLARFQAERQILAGLEHPGIARLLDGGLSDDGRPYMVQEFVEGAPIDQWCVRRRCDLRQKVERIIEVCDAVRYAHGKMIVHRDIKPSNILVTDEGRTRLIDFGVAQQVDPEDGGVVRSPVSIEFAAPELLEGENASVMTDVYGLAATLFELLTGRPPIDVAGLAAPLAVQRIADQPPARLVSLLPPAEARTALARDLDAVLDKALGKRAAGRYQTVEAFAADLDRALVRQPVTGRKDDRAYVARRFLLRNRWPVAAAAAVVLSLSGGLGVALDQAARAERERDAALQEQARLQAVQNYLYFMLRSASESTGADASATLNAAAGRVLEQFKADPEHGGPVVRMLGELYFYMNDYEAAEPLLTGLMTVKGVDPALVASAGYDLAQIKERQADPKEARRLLLRSQAFWGSDPIRWRSELVDSRLLEARLLRDEGKVEEAVLLLRGNLPARIAISGPSHRDTGVYHNDLGVMLVAAGRPGEAAPSFRAALGVWAANGLENGPDALNTLNNLAALEVLSGRPAQAEPLFRQAVAVRRELYGPSAATAALISNHGKTLVLLGRNAEAIPLLREASEMARRHAGVASLHYASAMAGLSEATLATGRTSEAERLTVAALGEVRSALGPDHPATAVVEIALGRVRAVQGRKGEARTLLDHATRTMAAIGPAGAAQIKAIDRIRARYGLR